MLAGRKPGRFTLLYKKRPHHARAGQRVILARPELRFAAHVMKQRRSDQHIHIDVFLRLRQRQRRIEHPVNMSRIVRAVAHAGQHILFIQPIAFRLHMPILHSLRSLVDTASAPAASASVIS